ncbi:SH3 domain-containing protein [Streptomyces sp. NPDC049881]|uniref:SH3 domain-containing protein n=1 Tax=unclassified Streptomyces TaxID=2593676 RepID=UPI0034426404
MKLRARLAALLPLTIAATTLAVTPAAMADTQGAAAECYHPWWENKDSDTGKTYEGSYSIRTGPNQGCPTVTPVIQSNVLFYHCFVTNSAGNTWTHVRVNMSGNDYWGWIWDGNLTDNGSKVRC